MAILVVFKKTVCLWGNFWGLPSWQPAREQGLSSLSTDPPGELDVLGHDGDTFGMDGAQVCVLKESNQVGLGCFLKCHHSWALKSQVGLEVLSDLTNKTLEGQLPDEQFRGLLVSSDFSQSHCTGSVSVRFLHTSSCWCTLASGLGCQLFTRCFSSSWFSCCLLGSCHDDIWWGETVWSLRTAVNEWIRMCKTWRRSARFCLLTHAPQRGQWTMDMNNANEWCCAPIGFCASWALNTRNEFCKCCVSVDPVPCLFCQLHIAERWKNCSHALLHVSTLMWRPFWVWIDTSFTFRRGMSFTSRTAVHLVT